MLVLDYNELQKFISLSVRSVKLLLYNATRDGRFGSKVGQKSPKWDKSGTFSDQISVHLAHRAKCTEI